MGLSWRNALRIIAALVAALVVVVLLLWRFREDIKSALLSGISGRITEMVKQRVVIGDLSFGPSTSLTLRALRIDSPEGVGEGALLTIDRMVLSVEVGALLSGRLHLPRVEIVSPELMLSKDGQGRFNISDGLMRLLTVKSDVKYRIDRLTIEGGAAVFRSEAAYRFDQVTLNLTNLSSEEGTKTLVAGSAGYGRGSIGVDGWVYIHDRPMKFRASVKVKHAAFPRLAELLGDLWAEAGQAAFSFDAEAESDDGTSIAFTICGGMTGGGRLPFVKKDLEETRLDGRASYRTSDDVLTIHGVSLHADQVISGRLTGVISDVRERPRYDAEVLIDRLDISALALPGGVSAAGVLSTDAVHVKGTLGKSAPRAKGAVLLSDASFRSKDVDLTGLNAKVSFDAGKEVSLSADAASKMTRMGGYALHEPSDLTLSIRAEGEPAAMTMSASLSLSAFRVNLPEKGEARVGRVRLDAAGTWKKNVYTGEAALKLGSFHYAGHGIEKAGATFSVVHSPGGTIVNDVVLDADGVRSSAGRIAVRPSEDGSAFILEVRNMNIIDRLHQAEVNDADVSLSVNVREKKGAGQFSVGTAAFRGVPVQGMSGGGRVGDGEFSIEIPGAVIAGGRLRMTAAGRTTEGLFPVSADIAAEGLDAAYLSDALSPFVKLPYSFAGRVETIAFRGIVESGESLCGNASLEGLNMTVRDKEKGKAVVKDGSFSIDAAFKGRDLEFSAEGKSGAVSATAVGVVREFTRNEREATLHVSLPEAGIADIRTSFWDVFPDSLLYLGLEGSLSSDMTVRLGENRLSGQGEVSLKDIRIEGENGEFSVGPIHGAMPFSYGESEEEGGKVQVRPHLRSELESIRRHYAGEFTGSGYRRLSLGSFRYGFPLLDDITLWVKQRGTLLDIGRFDAKIFGGRLNASGMVDVAGGPDYSLGILLEGMSLAQLCERIEPIRGYLSGKVDGIGTFRGSGPGLDKIVGAADFWTYRTKEEPTKISREFLQKVGGISARAYLGDRPFNKGDMRILVKDGFVLFRELDISNRNILGVQDLSVKVAPLHNRIAIDHLLWSLAEAGERAQKE